MPCLARNRGRFMRCCTATAAMTLPSCERELNGTGRFARSASSSTGWNTCQEESAIANHYNHLPLLPRLEALRARHCDFDWPTSSEPSVPELPPARIRRPPSTHAHRRGGPLVVPALRLNRVPLQTAGQILLGTLLRSVPRGCTRPHSRRGRALATTVGSRNRRGLQSAGHR